MSKRMDELLSELILLSAAIATGDEDQMKAACADSYRRELDRENETVRQEMLKEYLRKRDIKEEKARVRAAAREAEVQRAAKAKAWREWCDRTDAETRRVWLAKQAASS